MSLRSRTTTALLAASTAAAVSLLGATASATAGRPWPTSATPRLRDRTVLAKNVVGPFQIPVDAGKVYVADGFTGAVSLLTRSGAKVLTRDPKGGDVAGRTPCAAKAIRRLVHGPARYKGTVDSHPYGVASRGWRGWVVADAGGNDLLRVDRGGHVSTMAVLPRQTITVTARTAKAMRLPKCTVGVTYAFEPVPTDVAVARDGALSVSTLPGGPEDASLGARGSVHRVDVIRHAKVRKVLTIPRPLAVEVIGDHLYLATLADVDMATTRVKAFGKVLRYRL